MNIDSINTSIEIIRSGTSVKEVVNELIRRLKIEKIFVHFKTSSSKKSKINIPNKDVAAVYDSIFNKPATMVPLIKLVINAYIFFLDSLLSSKDIDFEEKRRNLQRAVSLLTQVSLSYNPGNRFLFTNQQIFFTKEGIKAKPVSFDTINFSPKLLNEVKELFLIRKEAFEELSRITQEYLSHLENSVWNYSPLQLSKKGQTLFTEIILGLEYNDQMFSKTANECHPSLKRELLNVLGISGKTFSEYRTNILRRDDMNIGKSLSMLSDSLENHPYRNSKLKKK